jgi:hypothetical protein
MIFTSPARQAAVDARSKDYHGWKWVSRQTFGAAKALEYKNCKDFQREDEKFAKINISFLCGRLPSFFGVAPKPP